MMNLGLHKCREFRDQLSDYETFKTLHNGVRVIFASTSRVLTVMGIILHRYSVVFFLERVQ
jgi:hypothetical protein